MTLEVNREVGKGFELDLAVFQTHTEWTAALRTLVFSLKSFSRNVLTTK